MDASQLIASLSAEQVAAVYAIRDSILAQHAIAEQAFVLINNQLSTDIAKLTTDIETANAQIAVLQSIKPFDDGLIRIEAFMKRCRPHIDKLMFAANDEDPPNGFGQLVSILNAKLKANEPVNLRSVVFANAIVLVLTLPAVTAGDIAELTKPASREEAWVSN
jgi:hypothetical protein